DAVHITVHDCEAILHETPPFGDCDHNALESTGAFRALSRLSPPCENRLSLSKSLRSECHLSCQSAILKSHHTPTVSPLMISLVYCHIKSFQRASSMEKPSPGGENKRDGWASPHGDL